MYFVFMGGSKVCRLISIMSQLPYQTDGFQPQLKVRELNRLVLHVLTFSNHDLNISAGGKSPPFAFGRVAFYLSKLKAVSGVLVVRCWLTE